MWREGVLNGGVRGRCRRRGSTDTGGAARGGAREGQLVITRRGCQRICSSPEGELSCQTACLDAGLYCIASTTSLLFFPALICTGFIYFFLSFNFSF